MRKRFALASWSKWVDLIASVRPGKGPIPRGRRLRVESLETRSMMAVVDAVFINNSPFISEGDDLVLEGASYMFNNLERTTEMPGVSFAWDFNGDQVFDAFGLNTSIPWSTLQSLPNLPVNDGLGFYTFHLYALDTENTNTVPKRDESTLVVLNVDPTISNDSSVSVVGGGDCGGSSDVMLNAVISDVNPADTVEIEINWGDGNGGTFPLNPGPITLAEPHTYLEAGSYTVTLTATDDDGGQTIKYFQVEVTGGGGGTVSLDNGVLLVNATCEADWVHVSAPTGQIRVQSNFLETPVQFAAADVQQIVVQLKGGDDIFTIASGVTKPLAVVGGDGNDVIAGGVSRSILIGGDGQDLLVGGRGQDVLIDSATTHDGNVAALGSLLTEWASSHSLEDRVRNLVDGSGSVAGLNDGHFLTIGGTILGDDHLDILYGGGATDWFLLDELDLAILPFWDIIGDDLDDLFG